MRVIGLAILMGLLLPAYAQAECTDQTLETVTRNILYCRDACAGSGSHPEECEGSAYMKLYARRGDPDGVRDGFNKCHPRNVFARAQSEACHDERPKDYLNAARWVYGFPPVRAPRARTKTKHR